MRQNDTRGSMPFAIAAVTILLVSVFAAAVSFDYSRSEDATDGVKDSIDAVDIAVSDVTSYINRGFGEIIRSVSTDADAGSLAKRAETIQSRIVEWIDFQFPMRSGGTTVTYISHDVELRSEPMGITDSEGTLGYTPTYIRGIGTVTAGIESQSGSTETELTIYTDGNYALPLALDRASLMESMAGKGSISLSQMLSYQLTSIAQYRVLNGYGALNAYGYKGTDGILTESDVLEAYRFCIDAISEICFRDGGGSEEPKDRADLADLLASDDGTISIDLSAVYAQAMAAVIDDVAIKWMDYLYAFEWIEAVDRILNPLKGALNSLCDFLSGKERVSGVPYLRDMMAANGYSEEDYRYPGAGVTTISVGEKTISVSNPTADLFDQGWLKEFKKNYESDGNYVRDFVMDVLNGAAVRLAERTDLGTVSVKVDPYDQESFIESLTSLYLDAVDGCMDAIDKTVSESLRSGEVYDEFYGRLADEVMDHASDLVLEEELENRIRSAVTELIGNEELDIDIEEFMASKDVKKALSSYRSSVYADLSGIPTLKEVKGGDGSIIKKALTAVCSYGLSLLDILVPVEDTADVMVKEILEMDALNPYGGVVDLPGSETFHLTDSTGREVVESLSLEIAAEDPVVNVSRPTGVHTVGFREDESAAYSTTFGITVRGWVDYEVNGSGTLAQAMGSTSSAVKGGFEVDTSTEVTVASGWALEGVVYEPSCTIWTDIEDILLDVFEPLIEPLRKLMEAMRGAATELAEALRDIAGFVYEHLIDLYNIFMDPVGELSRMISEGLEALISETALKILVDINLGDQSLTFQFFGCTLVIKTSAITWKSNTKTLFSAEMSMPVAGLTVNAGMSAKYRGDIVDKTLDPDKLLLTFTGGITGDDWSVSANVDPLMKSSKYLFSVTGKAGKNKISLVAPKLEDYHQLGLTLSDIPAVGDVLNNIPVPFLGVNVGLDAGFEIRCKSQEQTGLLINEYESNPAGTDRGNEWVEILNNTDRAIDLTGYTLCLESKKKDEKTELSGTLSQGEFLVVKPDFTLVNDPSQDSRSAEKLVIRDANGDIVEEVKMKRDNSDDGDTWQRGYDGSSEWVKRTGTMGRTNGNWVTSEFNVDALKKCAWSAVEKSFGKIGSITDLDSLVAFIQYLVRFTIEGLIDLVADLIIDASVFVSADLKDATSTVTSGIRVAFRTDGDLVKDCLRYVAGKVESLLLGIKNPYSIDPLAMFTENIDLEVMLHAGVGFPELLSKGADLPEMDLCMLLRTNLASLTRIAGIDTGDPGIEFGILARDCPKAVIPSKLGAKDTMKHDLWLFKATVTLA